MSNRMKNRTRNQRAAKWAEFWAIATVCGFLTLIFLLGMCVAFAMVETAWYRARRRRLTVGTGQPPGEKPKA